MINKKITLFLYLLVPYLIHANDYSTLNELIKNSLDSNYKIIYDSSLNISDSERILLYEINKQSPMLYSLKNSCIGFGYGSSQQKDRVGRKIGIVGYSIGLGLCWIGFVFMMSPGDADTPEQQKQFERDWKTGQIILATGGVTLLTFNFIGIFRPISYSNKYNVKLKSALRLSKDNHSSNNYSLKLSYSKNKFDLNINNFF